MNSTRERWLQDAATLNHGELLYLHPRGDLTQDGALAALDAQYGNLLYDAWQHGEALRISRGKRFTYGALNRAEHQANEAIWEAYRRRAPSQEVARLKAAKAELVNNNKARK